MVLEAVRALDNPKGVSAFAIKHYITHQYPGVSPVRLKYHLKQALVKGINKGYLVRPPRSSAQGASGSFKCSYWKKYFVRLQLGKEKPLLGKGQDTKSTGEAKLKAATVATTKQAKAPAQTLKRKGAEQVKKKPSRTKPKPEAALGSGEAAAPAAEPMAKAPKSKGELKGLPEAKVKSKPPQTGKGKGKTEPKGAIARSRAASEAKAARAKEKPKT